MNFFRKRRERESAAAQPSQAQNEQLGSFASSEGQPVVGQQVGGGAQFGGLQLDGAIGMTEGLAVLSQLGPMIQQAIADGNVSVQQGEAQTIDMRGSGLREEILGIMQQHGIDAEAGTANQAIDAGAHGDMQKQLLEALAKHGIDPGASGTSINFQVSTDDDS